MNFGVSAKFPLSLGFAKVEEVVRNELQEAGFGVLTEIDVKETMKKKINVDYEPYKILGACIPKLANEVLQSDPEIGLLLPCNVVIYEKGEDIIVSMIQPLAMFSIIENAEVKPIAENVGTLLSDSLERINSKLTN
ncbi:MAG: DUF302 domain-containing protein [Candidatus Kariarchaeaceae archaeon]|jgi:uncharacterized protein (DUF302 family)